MENIKLAGIGKRILALIIDWIVISLVQTTVNTIFFSGAALSISDLLRGDEIDTQALAGIIGTSHLVSLAIYLLYDGLLTSSDRQGTLGKMALKIKVVNESGQKLSQNESLLRAFMKIVSSSICCIGYFIAFFNKKEQSLHDIVGKTYVVEE